MGDWKDFMARKLVDGPLGEDGVYTPKGGEPEPLRVIIGDERTEYSQGFRGTFATIQVHREDVPEPEVDDLVEARGQTWKVRPRPDDERVLFTAEGALRLLNCSRDMRPTMER